MITEDVESFNCLDRRGGNATSDPESELKHIRAAHEGSSGYSLSEKESASELAPVH